MPKIHAATGAWPHVMTGDKGPGLPGRPRVQQDCRKVQSVACAHEPRRLQPLQITDRLYREALEVHQIYERVHLHDRGRYTVGGREVSVRDHRLGINCQQLRAHAAMFLDSLRIAARHGWFASLRPVVRQTQPARRPAAPPPTA